MRISELSRECATHIETIRFYEREGLLPEMARGLASWRQAPPMATAQSSRKGADKVPRCDRHGRRVYILRVGDFPFTPIQRNESAINHIQPMVRSTPVTFCACLP